MRRIAGHLYGGIPFRLPSPVEEQIREHLGRVAIEVAEEQGSRPVRSVDTVLGEHEDSETASGGRLGEGSQGRLLRGTAILCLNGRRGDRWRSVAADV